MSTVAKQLAQEEGRSATVYKDHLGYWTVGVGICIDDRVDGAGLDEEEQDWLLDRRLASLTRACSAKIAGFDQLNEARQAVLIGMAFQMGLVGLLGFKNTLAAVTAGNYEVAARGMLNSKWATQTPGRAKRMAEQMRTGEWQAKEGFTLP